MGSGADSLFLQLVRVAQGLGQSGGRGGRDYWASGRGKGEPKER